MFCSAISRRRRLEGVALVITLLMLSVITFLAVAFLAMSRRNQSAVVTSLDNTTAQSMAQAATARAQAEIMAQILASGDALNYDYMVSRNAINPVGFNNSERSTYDPNNVNYDYLSNSPALFNNTTDPIGWVQNIANLYYDPRPPVFVVTNQLLPNNYDFRFWVDLNRNGRFETNGYQPTITNENLFAFGPSAVLNGEPEFIGVLKNPLQHHSSVNQFLGRYAYLVLPVGKTLDLNYIHNFLKASYTVPYNGTLHSQILTNTGSPGPGGFENDGFARDQGIGSWEINLAALLDNLSPWAYETNNGGYRGYLGGFGPYKYIVPDPAYYDQLWNFGSAFDDAEAILHYRYMPPNYSLESLVNTFPLNFLDFERNYMDIYCAVAPTAAPFDYDGDNPPASTTLDKTIRRQPWAGSYPTNMFFDPQDLFDPTKTSVYFTNRMILASQRTNTYDRYTFERLLSTIGMGSSPEYGVWVYGDNDTNNRPTQLRTKININYDNTAQITNINAPYAPMPTNLVSWQPGTFFNNAAELLLRSQPHYFPFYLSNAFGVVIQTNIVQANFGVTNIPVFRASNPGVHYDAAIHRMLQLAANIYDATNPTNLQSAVNPNLPFVRHPTVFRPLFQVVNPGTTNVGLNIYGYVQVINGTNALQQMLLPYQEMSNVVRGTFNTNWNVAGIPWIVGANKGLPAFYRYTAGSQITMERKLMFPRQISGGVVQKSLPPATTNQFYLFALTNCLAIDAWNPYPTFFYGSSTASPGLYYYFSNYVTVQLNNGFNFVTNIVIASSNFVPVPRWAPGGGIANSKAGFLSILNTNLLSLPECYFSLTKSGGPGMVLLTNADYLQNSWLSSDTSQKGWPVYNWTLNVTNHLVYALFDGNPQANSGSALLDFVNLGPFGSSTSITNFIAEFGGSPPLGTTASAPNYFAPGLATALPTSPMSVGVLNQINTASSDPTWFENLIGKGSNSSPVLGCPFNPTWVVQQPTNWVANDPLVHYTVEDLTWTGNGRVPPPIQTSESDFGDLLAPPATAVPPLTNYLEIGTVSPRYSPWGSRDVFNTNILLKDPGIVDSLAWQFPTNKFPSVGWIGRVHRGTPWQTVFLKADSSQSYALWSNWANPSWISTPNLVYIPETYPTNDYPLVDVFSTAFNDSAAHGLLSVNQINDPAWAAVFAGVIALTNIDGGTPIGPINDDYGSIQYLMDSPLGINAQRTNQPNGIFHKVGYILSAPALTVNSPYLPTNGPAATQLTDEMVERIPQQTLSLLKVGEPQFAIYAWGQALRPKGPPYLGIGPNANIYTNYEITGEFLTRTVCHLVHTNGLKMVIDNYNVESGN